MLQDCGDIPPTDASIAIGRLYILEPYIIGVLYRLMAIKEWLDALGGHKVAEQDIIALHAAVSVFGATVRNNMPVSASVLSLNSPCTDILYT